MAKKVYRVELDKRALQSVARQSPKWVDESVAAVAFDGLRYVKESFTTSPSAAGEPPGVDTGTLRNGMNVQREKTAVYNINTGRTEYAPYLEFGTSRMAARPFMEPLAEYLEKNATKTIQAFLAEKLR